MCQFERVLAAALVRALAACAGIEGGRPFLTVGVEKTLRDREGPGGGDTLTRGRSILDAWSTGQYLPDRM
jgi:hypothetical protein